MSHATLRALCVGIDTYTEKPLKGAVADAASWAAALSSSGFLCSLLLNQDASFARILAELGNIIATSNERSVIVFQFAGLGVNLPNGDSSETTDAICPYDVDLGHVLTGADLATVRSGLPPGAAFVAFLDCCFAGVITIARAGAAESTSVRPGFTARFLQRSSKLIAAHRRFRRTRQVPAKDAKEPEYPCSVFFNACGPDELAWEGARGEFSRLALEVLPAAGAEITNHEFEQEAQIAFRQGEIAPLYAQTPRLECAPPLRACPLLQSLGHRPRADGGVKAERAVFDGPVERWNRWRRKASPKATLLDLSDTLVGARDLSGINLSYVNLSGVHLGGANLTAANFRGAFVSKPLNCEYAKLVNADLSYASLPEARFRWADLTNARLRAADLRSADLRGANLTAADLSGSLLMGVDFRGANLAKSEFRGAACRDTIFGDNDLREVTSLDSVLHWGPSIIGISSLYNSHGQVPVEFLRGIGLSETEIEAASKLVPHADDYWSCFISYASADTEFAEQLYRDLKRSGVRCWYAPESLRTGNKIRASIHESIRASDKVLLVLSKDSISSLWVETEFELAFDKERSQKDAALFPVRLDNAALNTTVAWARDVVTTRQVGDFTQWRRKAEYARAFGKLLRDLRRG